MSITDELRKYANRFKNSHDAWSGIGDDLTAIADRIDAEHDKALNSVDDAYDSGYNVGYDEGFASADDWLAQHEDAMAQHGWIRLPKDANGEYIHVGDVMELVSYDEDYRPVIRTVNAVGEQVFFAWSKENGRYAQYEACAYRHHAPTVEDVLTEFGIDWEHESDCEDRAALLKEYAAKLRLAGEDA